MTFNLGLAQNLFGLGLAAGSNHIYPGHMTADITLINSGSEVNVMTPADISKLGLRVCRTNVGAQKINSSAFKTFGIVLASF